jgi:hypothetical protein
MAVVHTKIFLHDPQFVNSHVSTLQYKCELIIITNSIITATNVNINHFLACNLARKYWVIDRHSEGISEPYGMMTSSSLVDHSNGTPSG